MLNISDSVSSIAKGIQGNISNVREVLSSNPHLSPFTFPPAVQQGIVIAEKLGIHVPSEDELLSLANGEIDKLIGTLGKDVSGILDTVDSLLGRVTKKAGDAQQLLNSISWLL